MLRVIPSPPDRGNGLLRVLIRHGAAALFATGAAAMALACSGERPPTRHSLILISLDTLRADRIGAYGYDRDTSPALDALAARGVRFDTVIAESSWTLPSHMTLFTGLPPTLHGVTSHDRALSKDVPTLTEVLREAGYRTFAFTGGLYVAPNFGFGRGFEIYVSASENAQTGERSPLGLAAALKAAARRISRLDPEESFFAFIHTFDVHCPYDPPESHATRFDSRPAEDHLETEGRCGDPDYNAMSLREGQARFLSDRYDAGIRYADDLLKAFFAQLEKTGVLERSFVVVVSDHGEEFLEHGKIGHQTLFIETLRVPWIVAGPGLAPGVVTEPVGLADVMPTLLDLLGVPAPPTEGESMLAWMRGERTTPGDRSRFSELEAGPAMGSAVVGDFHAVADRRSGRLQIFDWRADPDEQEDLAGSDPARDQRLAKILRDHWTRMEQSPHRSTPGFVSGVDPEQRERLRALGYLD
jgi:arylsulfatase A-like enzyme